MKMILNFIPLSADTDLNQPHPEPASDVRDGATVARPPVAPDASTLPPTIRALRTMLFGVFVFGAVGTGTELMLLDHTEDILQWIPLGLLVLGLIVAALCVFRPGRGSLRVMRATMGLFVVSGCVGLVLHYQGNAEFELEMYPAMSGMQLFWESVRGATPTLSPGTMAVLGMIGWIYTFRHPALAPRGPAGDVRTGAFS